MRRQAVRILMIQLILAFILVNFNNCSGGFESGGLGGGDLSEQDSSSTGTGEPPEEATGPLDKEPDFCQTSAGTEPATINSVSVDGQDFTIHWTGSSCAKGFETVVGEVDLGRDSFVLQGVTEYKVTGLDYGTHCFRIESHFPDVQVWNKSAEVCATSVAPESDDDPKNEPPSSGGQEIVLDSRTYFVNPHLGNDSNSGLSPSKAWRSLAQVKGLRQRSAKVYLLSGALFFRQKLELNFGGSVDDWALVSCYYMDSGRPKQCTKQHEKPIIRGELTDACLQQNNCDYSNENYANTNTLMASKHDSLVRMYKVSAAYFSISHLRVEKSRGRGISIRAPSAGGTHHFIIEDIEVRDTAAAPVVLEDGVRDFVVRNVNASYYNTCEQQNGRNGATTLTNSCSSGGWPGGIQVVRSFNARGLIENNVVTRGFGEAYNCWISSYMIFRGNRASNTHSNGVYMDGCLHAVVENNILLGPNGDLGYHNDDKAAYFSKFGGGIVVGFEDIILRHHPNVDGYGHIIRNNLLVKTGPGIQLSMEKEAKAAGRKVGFQSYGNTIVASLYNDITTLLSAANIDENITINNVSWNEDKGSASCRADGPLAGDFNHWITLPGVSRCRGSSDSHGDPKLSLGSYTQWQQFNYTNFPTFEMARPQAGSPLRGSGTSEPVNTKVLNAGDYGFAFEQISDSIDRSCWEKGLCYDALNVRRNSASVTKGAVQ